MDVISNLSRVVDAATEQLRAIPASRAAQSPAPGKWSRKQELGHLIDSACNNHQRIVRAQLDETPSMPGYDGDRWVELHAYQNLDWTALIEQWKAANQQLMRAASALTPQTATRKLSVGGGDLITIGFLIEDYLSHLVHHLQHIGISVGETGTAA